MPALRASLEFVRELPGAAKKAAQDRHILRQSFNYPLVALSVLVAVSVSIAVLSLFFRVARLQGPQGLQARKWLGGSAVAIVAGIWITHLLGVLALSVPISAIHSSGMAAIQIAPMIEYAPTLVGASLAVMTVLRIYDGYLSSTTHEYHEQLELASTQLQHAATHDSLTGLPNRLLLARKLDELIKHSTARLRRFAVMLIDLDRFKEINDSLGHLAGDELLCIMSERIRSQVRASTALARLGGDEFVLVVEDLDDCRHAAGVAARLHQAISQPVTLCGIVVHVSASIGIARFPDDGSDSSALLQHADAAMYHVKNNERGGYKFYSSEIHTSSRERLEVDDALRKALTAGEFEFHYQPKVDVRTGRIEAAEALIRWRHPERGLVPPADFIPLAEETGLIVPIGEWGLREACRQAGEWQRTRLGTVPVAVNVSAKQFKRRDFAEVVARIVGESGLDPRLLELELTESAVMHDPESSIRALRQLTSLGVAISLDDFGTGYSSLSYLRRLPLTKLKIDRSFIQELGTNCDSEQIVRAIVSLGHNLHLKVIAEGVETALQLQFLRETGCDKYQGYYCSRPLPAEEFTKLVLANRAASPATLGLINAALSA